LAVLRQALEIDFLVFGWYSKIIEYSSVYDYSDRHYMFYSSNKYGRACLGLEVHETLNQKLGLMCT